MKKGHRTDQSYILMCLNAWGFQDTASEGACIGISNHASARPVTNQNHTETFWTNGHQINDHSEE